MKPLRKADLQEAISSFEGPVAMAVLVLNNKPVRPEEQDAARLAFHDLLPQLRYGS